MPRKPESRDACPYCGEIIPNHGVAKHQAQCPKWHEILLTAESGTQPVETLWHLRVQVAYNKNIWLDLEMLGTASLDKLDKYLCAFRLDYCGHQGMFRIVGCSEKRLAKRTRPNQHLKLACCFGIYTTFPQLLRPTSEWWDSGKKKLQPNIRLLCWHATGCRRLSARNVFTKPKMGAISLASI
jgi:hypothetical protein